MNPENQPVRVVAASGGVLWRMGAKGPEIAIVHRGRYNDHTLPKGKVQPGESWQDCAKREVKEETGFEAEILEHAGWVCYVAGEITKVVRFWNMKPLGEPQFQQSEEVRSVEWLTPREALEKLSYPGERILVKQQCPPGSQERRKRLLLRKVMRKLLTSPQSLQHRRLEAELGAYRLELGARNETYGGDASTLAAISIVEGAQEALEEGKVDQAWLAYDAARRMAIGSSGDAMLALDAVALRNEAEKLGSKWKKSTIQAILHEPLEQKRETLLPRVLKAMELRDLELQNAHFKVSRLGELLAFLTAAVLLLLGLILILAYWQQIPPPLGNWSRLTAVICFGALGGAISTMLSSVPEELGRRIPFHIIAVNLAFARPILGAAAAVAVDAFLQIGFISIAHTVSGAEFMAVSFAAGFSDRLLLRAVANLAGANTNKREPSEQGVPEKTSASGMKVPKPETPEKTDAAQGEPK